MGYVPGYKHDIFIIEKWESIEDLVKVLENLYPKDSFLVFVKVIE